MIKFFLKFLKVFIKQKNNTLSENPKSNLLYHSLLKLSIIINSFIYAFSLRFGLIFF